MKKISKELLKTYYWVIFLFAVFSVFIIINFSIYLWKENENDIKLVEEYIEYEMTALDERTDVSFKSKEEILMEIVEEAPKLRDVYLEIFYNNKKYAKAPYLPDRRHNFLDYYSVTKIYQPENFNEVKVNITRRNVRDRKLIIFVYRNQQIGTQAHICRNEIGVFATKIDFRTDVADIQTEIQRALSTS